MFLRVVGAFLVINAIAYAIQFVFNDLYQDGQGLEPKHIWQVIDYVAVVVILATLAVNFMRLRSLPPSGGEAISGQVPGRGVRVRHPDCTTQAAADCVSGASCSASCFVATPGVR